MDKEGRMHSVFWKKQQCKGPEVRGYKLPLREQKENLNTVRVVSVAGEALER